LYALAEVLSNGIEKDAYPSSHKNDHLIEVSIPIVATSPEGFEPILGSFSVSYCNLEHFLGRSIHLSPRPATRYGWAGRGLAPRKPHLEML